MQKHHKKFSTSSILDKDADKTFIELKKEKLERGIGYNLDKCNYNQKELREYCVHMRSTGLALTSIDNRLKCLRYFFNYVKKKSKDITRKDIENFLVNGWKAERIVEYSNGLKIKKKQGKWMPRTEQLYKLNILYFYIWSSNITKYDRLPVHVEWIKRKKIQKEYIDNILTREEIKKIMGNTVCLRDRCIISILYDAGLRISELAGLRIKDIELDSYGASIKVSGKTGERKIRLIDSVPVLKQWLNEHPMKEDNNKELFICLRNKFNFVLYF